ncbi:MAG: hypothetical protein AMJ41_00390 [candidate division Zixibacteria bacterium DG_27]|nr:MAG: hypothetical protein AMJ41_00390 [candidate division Zixibacteria bacterium DG_27]
MSGETEGKRPLLKVVMGETVKEVSYEELVLSTNLAQETLVRLLVEKKIIDPKEFWELLNKVRQERYKDEKEFEEQTGAPRESDPPSSASGRPSAEK